MSKPRIKIEIVSDVVCPWCYIGKRRLERAMSHLKDQMEFDVEFLPFELNPDMPKEGFDQKAYLTKKFGGDERYQQITDYVTKVAAQEGLNFNFQSQHKSPNTRNAHRIISLAKKEGMQPQIKEAFMKAYFEDGKDLTNQEVLVEVAASAGLDRKKILGLLNSDEELKEVIQKEQINHQRGISGVPFYIINGKYGISGAQPSETFVKAFKDIGLTVDAGLACDVGTNEC